jgi:hypothetical protein
MIMCAVYKDEGEILWLKDSNAKPTCQGMMPRDDAKPE